MSKQTNIPQLRFPEFTGEWEMKKLGEVCDSIMYGMNSAAIPFDGENKYLRITDIDEDSREFIPKPLVSPDGEIEEKYKLKYGDMVFTRTGASVGKTYLYNPKDGNLLFAGFLIKFSIINGNPYFIFSQTLKESYNKWVLKMSMRSGQPGLNAEECKELEIFFPTLAEQTKIATFLTAVDEKLQALKKKKSLLEEYKKGVMQRLFTLSESGFAGLKDEQDNKNPEILKSSKSKFRQLRFKDENGKEFPEWEVKKLGEVLNYEQPTNYLVSSTEYDNKFETPVVTAGKTFILGYTDEKNGIFKENLPVIIFDDFTTATQFVTFPFKAKSSAMKILKAKENANIKFIYEAMQMIDYETGGHGRHWISVFAEIELPFPSLPEQTLIANFLSSLDEKINHVQGQIEKTETWKKGLLQKMFV